MTLLESGPAKTDRNYWLIVGVLFLAFAAYFAYDGAYGYRNANIRTARKDLARWTDAAPELGETPTEAEYKQLRNSSVTSPEEVYAVFGQPLPPKAGSPREGVERFASAYGMATVPIDAGQLRPDPRGWDWRSWGHSKDDIRGQFYWAAGTVVLSLYFFLRVFRAAKLRAVVDEEGMTYGGRRIAFDDMVSLRDYNRKGWVDLYYRAGGQEKKLRIDNQKIARFEEIAELICDQKGFENPLKTVAADLEDDGPDDEVAAPSPDDETPPPSST